MGVTEDNTNLRRGGTLPGELADLLDDLVGGGLEPRGGVARVGDGRGRNALSVGVHATHLGGLWKAAMWEIWVLFSWALNRRRVVVAGRNISSQRKGGIQGKISLPRLWAGKRGRGTGIM